MEWTDAEAVALARAGDPDAFRLLVERHSRKIHRLAFRLTGNQTDAEDIVQETFLRAYRSLDSFDERAVFTTWIYRIATNHALDLLRSRKTRTALSLSDATPDQHPTDEDPMPDRLVFSGQLQDRLRQALEALTPMERTAFMLRHFEERSTEEIGAALKVTGNSAKQTVFRAVQKMRRALQPVVGEAVWKA